MRSQRKPNPASTPRKTARHFERIRPESDGTDIITVLEYGESFFVSEPGHAQTIDRFGLNDALTLVESGNWVEV